MSDTGKKSVAIQPVISYPRQAQVGKTYLLTVDLHQPEDGDEWPYEEEEYPIYCLLDTWPLFSSKPEGEPSIILHRFGGTYGPARFLLTAQQELTGSISVTLVNPWGVPIRVLWLGGIQITADLPISGPKIDDHSQNVAPVPPRKPNSITLDTVDEHSRSIDHSDTPDQTRVQDEHRINSQGALGLATRLIGYAPTDVFAQNNGELIRRAYATSLAAYQGRDQVPGRQIDNSLQVANTLLDLQLNGATIAAGLLHGIVDLELLTLEQVASLFGAETANIVGRVIHITRAEASMTELSQVDIYRRMFVAMAGDVRVLLTKLADRLQKLRSIQEPIFTTQRIARETLSIHAALAEYIGLWQLQSALEDRAFAILHPSVYEEIENQIKPHFDVRANLLQKIQQQLEDSLVSEGIDAVITSRIKPVYSIYRKMQRDCIRFDQVHDQLGIRVIVDNVSDCYTVLGLVNSLWEPLQDQMDDYIAFPKANFYRALHTTVLAFSNLPCEIQIRTHEMHELGRYR